MIKLFYENIQHLPAETNKKVTVHIKKLLEKRKTLFTFVTHLLVISFMRMLLSRVLEEIYLDSLINSIDPNMYNNQYLLWSFGWHLRHNRANICSWFFSFSCSFLLVTTLDNTIKMPKLYQFNILFFTTPCSSLQSPLAKMERVDFCCRNQEQLTALPEANFLLH